MRVAINGFGRIGRSVYRILSRREDIEVAAINDISEHEVLAYLLKFDSVMGRFPGDVRLEDGVLHAGATPPLSWRSATRRVSPGATPTSTW